MCQWWILAKINKLKDSNYAILCLSSVDLYGIMCTILDL